MKFTPGSCYTTGFQFIEFPSEWGVTNSQEDIVAQGAVSNLLSSPASGENEP